MPSLKRSASPRLTRLTARASPYNTSVTLFEAQDTASIPKISDSPRRSKRVKLEAEEPKFTIKEEENRNPTPTEPEASGSGSSTPKKRAAKSPRKPKPIQQSLAVPHPAPENWQETYATIKRMRSQIVAPVDTMGCDQAQYKEAEPKNRRFATLISLMLSSQTKDEVTDAAVSKLRSAIGGSLTVDALINAEDVVIGEAIGKVGFWRRKTEYIKKTAQRLRDDFDSDVPKTVDELCSLPGVGPKMAFLALQVAWNLNVGIGVDVHVHRITNRLGWHKPPTKNPEETRLNLQSWLPIELHPDINHMLVGFGQVMCLPVGPRCDLCDLSANGLCPSAQKVTKTKSRKAVTLTAVKYENDSPPKIEIALEPEETKPILSDFTLQKIEPT
ncbi:DNA glycosylase [Collybia nuda]|uniref:Endonuclease III homolog n=1 Tax=Collybia nuda TaxID=64659 RepID=A0A9P6CCP7_9AGAR|nr:DNA glycosylase [Collybia nuda]